MAFKMKGSPMQRNFGGAFKQGMSDKPATSVSIPNVDIVAEKPIRPQPPMNKPHIRHGGYDNPVEIWRDKHGNVQGYIDKKNNTIIAPHPDQEIVYKADEALFPGMGGKRSKNPTGVTLKGGSDESRAQWFLDNPDWDADDIVNYRKQKSEEMERLRESGSGTE